MRLMEYSMAAGLTVLGTSLMAVGHLVSVRVISLAGLNTWIMGIQFEEIGFVLVSVGLLTGSMMFIMRKLRLM